MEGLSIVFFLGVFGFLGLALQPFFFGGVGVGLCVAFGGLWRLWLSATLSH